jgi:hypothetical protein
MLELVSLEAPKWRLQPSLYDSLALGRPKRRDAFLNQFAQMILEGRGELGIAGEGGVGADEHSLVGEVSPPESIERRELLQLLLAKVTVPRIEGRGLQASIDKEIRGAAFLRGVQRLLELPLGTCQRSAPINAAILANRGPLR